MLSGGEAGFCAALTGRRGRVRRFGTAGGLGDWCGTGWGMVRMESGGPGWRTAASIPFHSIPSIPFHSILIPQRAVQESNALETSLRGKFNNIIRLWGIKNNRTIKNQETG